MADNYCMHCMERIEGNELSCKHCQNSLTYEAPVHHIKPGTILKDKYLIGCALGEGGFGITYTGRDLTLDMRIAVKEFYPNGYSHRNHNYTNEVTLTQSSQGQNFEKDMQRFLHEARTLAKFSDESGIVGVRDFFRENGTAYIVMEFLDGVTLKTYLQERGPIPADQLFAMIEPVLLSLARVHTQGVIHRDISPDNIMVLKTGRIKLLDFGAAREVSGDKSLSVVLKHGYAPEEQYRTKGKQGPWTDVYAMCATIYKCLTGITPMESLERVYHDELEPPTKLGVALSKSQEATLLKGLQVRVGDRIQTMNELWKGFSDTEGSETIQSVALHRQVETEPKTVYEVQGREPETSAAADEAKTVYLSVAADEAKTVYQAAAAADKAKTVYQAATEDDAKTVYQAAAAANAAKEVHQTASVADAKPFVPPVGTADSKHLRDDKEALRSPLLEKQDASIQPQKQEAEKKPTNPKKVLLFALIAMLVITLVLVPIVISFGSDTPETSMQDSIPTERVLASDCSTVLKWSNISGSVLDVNIQEKNLNEKYKTLMVSCNVAVFVDGSEEQYLIDLYYEYEDTSWVLSNLSEIK